MTSSTDQISGILTQRGKLQKKNNLVGGHFVTLVCTPNDFNMITLDSGNQIQPNFWTQKNVLSYKGQVSTI